MAIMPKSARDLFGQLRDFELLGADQLEKVGRSIKQLPNDPMAFLKELVRRQFLTPFQANRIAKGLAKQLVVGPYRLIELLGKGGMGQVYKARHVHMNRIVALKFVQKEFVSNPTAIKRFYREAQAAAQLSHPNIIIAHDAGQAGDLHFLAMEYVQGTDLSKLVHQSEPLSIPVACEFIRQAAAGLQHAHEKGLVHRDIKPGNLLVARAGPKAEPIVKILDFGLARFADDSRGRTKLTQTGRIMGTIDYVSPEQAENARNADIRSDIYSLGCSLYFLLTGKAPFPGDSDIERLSARLVGTHEPIRKIRPDIPQALEEIIGKMIARNPAERYQLPRDVIDALQPFSKIIATSVPNAKSQIVAQGLDKTQNTISSNQQDSVAGGSYASGTHAVSNVSVVGRMPSQTRLRLIFAGIASAAALISICVVMAILLSGGSGGKNRNERLVADGSKSRLKKTNPDVSGNGGNGKNRNERPVADGSKSRLNKTNPDVSGNGGNKASSPRKVVLLKGHESRNGSGVLGLAISDDGKHVLSGGADGTVRLWGVYAGKELKKLDMLEQASRVAISPEGNIAAIFSGLHANRLRYWSLTNGKVFFDVLEPSLQGYPPFSLQFSPNGNWILSVHGGRGGLLRDAKTGKQIKLFKAVDQIVSMDFATDGKSVVTGGNAITIWDVRTGAQLSTFGDSKEQVGTVAFFPDNQHVLSVGSVVVREAKSPGDLTLYEVTLRIWKDGKQIREIDLPGTVHTNAHFSKNRKRVVFRTQQGESFVTVWDLSAAISGGQISELWRIHQDPHGQTAFSADGQLVLIPTRDGVIHVWRLPNDTGLALKQSQPTGVLVVIYTRADGGLSVRTPPASSAKKSTETKEQFLARMTKDLPKNARARVIDSSELPVQHVQFRDAWEDTGTTIRVNMVKARQIHRKTMLQRRDVKLRELNNLLQRAMDDMDRTSETQLKNQRQHLRAMETWLNLEKFKTPEALIASTPVELRDVVVGPP